MSRLALLGGTPIRTKPFPSWPVFDEGEEVAVLELIKSGQWWCYSFGEGSGESEPEAGQPRSKVAEFQTDFARLQGAKYGIACGSGTAAIEVALKALGVGPGDEVIVPPYTFVATASAVLLVNAIPIFADIDPDTFNLDPKRAQEAITPRTRAIIPVHFAGQAADLKAIMDIAKARSLVVIEDAAHGHGGEWNGCGLGSIGDAGTFSFQASKNMTAGEGGLITTGSREVAALCESYIWGGRKSGAPWYEHYRLGWNYRMTEFQGAILSVQLRRVREQNATRRQNALHLDRRLSEIPGIRPLALREYATRHSHHIYIFRFDPETFGASRERFLDALAAEGVPCASGYGFPLYKNPMFLKQDFNPRGCPLTCGHYDHSIDYASFEALCPAAERACREAVWLEHRLLLGTPEDMDDIARAVEKIYEHRAELGAPAKQSTARS
ncbi:MAG: DegT/DnrJ/EryC1/StrS family aminotransferase [Terriglobia bacterium]